MRRFWKKNNASTVNCQLSTVVSVLLTLILLIAFGCSPNKLTHVEQYTCPMHPTVVQDKPGNCPVCGMELVLKGKLKTEVIISDELNYLLKPVNATVISSIKTIVPIKKSIEIGTKINGLITYDTRAFTTISSRFDGRIEKIFVKFNFQSIYKGQKILEIYSPDLLTAQRDLLYLLKSDKENSQLIDGAKEKLRLLGASDQQIDQLISIGRESSSFNVYSPAEGYIISSNENLNSQSELEVREGMYVTAGQIIFRVVNPKNVWAEFNLHSKDTELIKVNEPIQIQIEETGEEIDAKINFVQPFYKDVQSFTKVRVYLPNSNEKYRIGQLVSASFNKPQESMWVPLSAQLDLGMKKIVFVKREGIFQPREITTGNQSDNLIEVLKGIEVKDSIAYNAQFMIDSEGFIKIKN